LTSPNEELNLANVKVGGFKSHKCKFAKRRDLDVVTVVSNLVKVKVIWIKGDKVQIHKTFTSWVTTLDMHIEWTLFRVA
jgi:hypothetical protein